MGRRKEFLFPIFYTMGWITLCVRRGGYYWPQKSVVTVWLLHFRGLDGKMEDGFWKRFFFETILHTLCPASWSFLCWTWGETAHTDTNDSLSMMQKQPGSQCVIKNGMHFSRHLKRPFLRTPESTSWPCRSCNSLIIEDGNQEEKHTTRLVITRRH